MPTNKKDEGFEKLCRENWEYVYNIAFSICYDGEIARRAMAEMFYTLGRLVSVKKRAFNSYEWMQNTVTCICADILREYIIAELKAYRGRITKSAEVDCAAGVDFNHEKIILLCEDPMVNDECFRNLTLGEKTALSLLCVHDMSLNETSDYLKIKKADLKKLKEKGIEKITGAVNLFGKICYNDF